MSEDVTTDEIDLKSFGIKLSQKTYNLLSIQTKRKIGINGRKIYIGNTNLLGLSFSRVSTFTSCPMFDRILLDYLEIYMPVKV